MILLFFFLQKPYTWSPRALSSILPSLPQMWLPWRHVGTPLWLSCRDRMSCDRLALPLVLPTACPQPGNNITRVSIALDKGLAHNREHFLSFARSKLRLCSANHRAGYWSNLPCDWLSIVWAYSEQETEKGPSWQAITWTNDDPFNLLAGECYRTSLMICQHWFK